VLLSSRKQLPQHSGLYVQNEDVLNRLLRGHEKARGEYRLGCTAWNIKRLHTLRTT
jgi:hypothetical protein